MTLKIRQARPEDASDMVGIINPIIMTGGTTAHMTPFDDARMTRHYISPKRKVSCVLAKWDDAPAGFQSLAWPDEEGDPFPDGWAIIASFVDQSMAGKGIGRALFEQTMIMARQAGVTTIDATIRADNSSGLGYYERMGFRTYEVLPAVALRDGTRVDRIRKKLEVIPA